MAAFYLYGKDELSRLQKTKYLSKKQSLEIKNLLIKQKNWIEAYTSLRPDYYLITENCPLVVTNLANILRGIKQSPNLKFLIPKEGTFLSIENLAIPIHCSKIDQVHELINYLYKPEVLKNMHEEYSDMPTLSNAIDEIELLPPIKKFLSLSKEEYKEKILFFKPIISEQKLQDLWAKIKSH